MKEAALQLLGGLYFWSSDKSNLLWGNASNRKSFWPQKLSRKRNLSLYLAVEQDTIDRVRGNPARGRNTRALAKHPVFGDCVRRTSVSLLNENLFVRGNAS